MTVTVSTKYQVVIPKEVRESMGVETGMKFEVIEYGGLIQLVPVKPISEMQGFLAGMDTDPEREKTDREV